MLSPATCFRYARRSAMIGTVAASLLLAGATAPLNADPRDGKRQQLAQTVSPFVGKWGWSSDWGPIELNITEVLSGGRPRGTLKLNTTRGTLTFQLADKISGVEMKAKITGNHFVGRLYSGSVFDLRLVDGKLVGKYARGDSQVADAVFSK